MQYYFFHTFRCRKMALVVLMFMCLSASAQTSTSVQGTVTDSDGQPLVGVTIQDQNHKSLTVTDTEGRFTVSVPRGTRLHVTYLGTMPQDVIVSKSTLNIVLKNDVKQLNDVVVVGYGVQQKKLITGATSQIKGDDIAKINSVNPLAALQSSASGVQLTQTSGMPGEGYKVYIRGIGTTGGSQPLVLIDGVAGMINDLNPADIESVDVLKDAASAAIYGSRAANGVILVTTKQGKKGKAQLTYNGYAGWQNVLKMPDLLNAQQYAMIMNEEKMMDGLSPYDFSKLVPNWKEIESGEWKGTNWMEEIRKHNALVTNHSINVTGGNDAETYSLGLSYTYQDGVLGKPVQPNFKRYTARINSDHAVLRTAHHDLLNIGEKLTYTYTQGHGITVGDNYGNNIRDMLKASPFLPNKTEDGQYHYSIAWDPREPNPVGIMHYGSGMELSKSHNIRGSVYTILQPIKNLKLKSDFGLSLSYYTYRSFVPVYKLSTANINDQSDIYQSAGSSVMWKWENTANYTFNLKEKHHIDILLGQSMERSGLGESIEGNNTNSLFNDFKHAYLINTPIISTRTTLSGRPEGEQTLASVFGRINYDYNNRYMATLVMRADGSSIFAPGHRWGTFPSVSAGWVISEEHFMKPMEHWLNFLKIRAGWGQNGNQDIAGYQYLSTYSFAFAGYTFGTDKSVETTGAYADILANPDITWETSEQTDIGFDALLFKSRLSFNFDYYIKNTKNWLVQAPILATAGTGAPFINGGDVRNEGIELSLAWNDRIGAFKYGVNFNFAYNKNKVTRIANSEGIIHGEPNVLSNATDEMYRAQVGYPIGFFYGYKTAGIFQNEKQIAEYKKAKLDGARPGDVIWVDTNNDGKIDVNDKTMIGNPHPDCTFGMGVNMAWKGFDLAITLAAQTGNQIMKSYRSFVDYPANNYTTDILKRWHGNGTSTRWPRLTSATSSNWQWVSDLYMEDGSFIRCQNLTVGYDFKNLFQHLPVQQLRLYAAANNLFVLTHYSGMDPEVGYGGASSWASGIDLGFYPSPRTIMIGLDIKF